MLNTEGFIEEDAVVVFETVYDIAEDTEDQAEDVIVAEHKDLTDEDQTITFVIPVIPEIPATGEGMPIAAVTGLALIATNIALIWYNLKKRNKRK
jgi:LPXTG-motif cell wall-anchored protein